MVRLTMVCDVCGSLGTTVLVTGNVMRSIVDGMRGASDFRRMRPMTFGPLSDVCPSCAKQVDQSARSLKDQDSVKRGAKAR